MSWLDNQERGLASKYEDTANALNSNKWSWILPFTPSRSEMSSLINQNKTLANEYREKADQNDALLNKVDKLGITPRYYKVFDNMMQSDPVLKEFVENSNNIPGAPQILYYYLNGSQHKGKINLPLKMDNKNLDNIAYTSQQMLEANKYNQSISEADNQVQEYVKQHPDASPADIVQFRNGLYSNIPGTSQNANKLNNKQQSLEAGQNLINRAKAISLESRMDKAAQDRERYLKSLIQ